MIIDSLDYSMFCSVFGSNQNEHNEISAKEEEVNEQDKDNAFW